MTISKTVSHRPQAAHTILTPICCQLKAEEIKYWLKNPMTMPPFIVRESMKKPNNRIAVVETQEQAPEPSGVIATGSQCPVCGKTVPIVSERVASNRVIRQYRCEKCNVFFTREA